MWVRGLKRKGKKNKGYVIASHPMWVRGLKLNYAYLCGIINQVAPYVGAWIET